MSWGVVVFLIYLPLGLLLTFVSILGWIYLVDFSLFLLLELVRFFK